MRNNLSVSIISRFAAMVACVGCVAGLFAFAGGWFSPHALTLARMVDTFEKVNGPQPGFRRNHSKGVGVSGFFISNGQGESLSKASVFKPRRVAVIGRFALAAGQAYVTDDAHITRSMAILFKLADGQEWRTGMNNIPVFPVATPQDFYELLIASAPTPGTGKPDPAKMKTFLSAHANVAKAMKLIHAAPISSGFENSEFNSLDAFHFINSNGVNVPVRWAMAHVQDFQPLPATRPAEAGNNFLFDALIAAVYQHPLRWKLLITVGRPEDPTNDASIAWPSNREPVGVGTLTINSIESEETSPARDINFDPLILPNGIVG